MFKKYHSLNAVRFTEENKDQVFNSLTGQFSADFEDGKPILKIKTVQGETAIIRIGDWVVEDAKIGTYYPIKDEIFKEQYV